MPVLAPKSYVEYRNDAYWVKGTRISLDSIVYAFQKGLSPESIVQSFPLLTLEQCNGRHQDENLQKYKTRSEGDRAPRNGLSYGND